MKKWAETLATQNLFLSVEKTKTMGISNRENEVNKRGFVQCFIWSNWMMNSLNEKIKICQETSDLQFTSELTSVTDVGLQLTSGTI